MHTTLISASVLFGLASFGEAVPFQLEKRAYTVERVANPNFNGYDGPSELAKAYRKFNIEVPSYLQDAISPENVQKRWLIFGEDGIFGELGQGWGQGQGQGNGNSNGQGAGGGNGNAGGGWPGRHGHHGHHGKGTATGAAPTGAGTPPATPPAHTPGTSPTPAPATGKGSTGSSGSSGQSSSGSGKVSATPANGGVEYVAPVNIGGQTLTLDFDTGSSDMWVFNTQMQQSEISGHTAYNPSKSKTFSQIQGAQFMIQYGDGSGAEGTVGTDVVNLGGAVVQKQAVELATQVTETFMEDHNSDGLLGLAFSKLNTVQPQQQKTFFANVMSSLSEPVFTANLKKSTAGAYQFGTIDSTQFTGSLSWADINTANGFWEFSSKSFSVGSSGSKQSIGGAGSAIADTGTTLLLADESVVKAYYGQVKGATNNTQAGGFTFPCSAQLPNLFLDIGGSYMAEIDATDINFTPLEAGSSTCFGGLQAAPAGSFSIYGDIMFKSQFVAFNGGNNSIGMAPHA